MVLVLLVSHTPNRTAEAFVKLVTGTQDPVGAKTDPVGAKEDPVGAKEDPLGEDPDDPYPPRDEDEEAVMSSRAW